jgi:hypothetical protein
LHNDYFATSSARLGLQDIFKGPKYEFGL